MGEENKEANSMTYYANNTVNFIKNKRGKDIYMK